MMVWVYSYLMSILMFIVLVFLLLRSLGFHTLYVKFRFIFISFILVRLNVLIGFIRLFYVRFMFIVYLHDVFKFLINFIRRIIFITFVLALIQIFMLAFLFGFLTGNSIMIIHLFLFEDFIFLLYI